MTVDDISHALPDGCRAGTEAANLESFQAADAVSVEARDTGIACVTEGLDAIRAKHACWDANARVHAAEVEGPFAVGKTGSR